MPPSLGRGRVAPTNTTDFGKIRRSEHLSRWKTHAPAKLREDMAKIYAIHRASNQEPFGYGQWEPTIKPSPASYWEHQSFTPFSAVSNICARGCWNVIWRFFLAIFELLRPFSDGIQTFSSYPSPSPLHTHHTTFRVIISLSTNFSNMKCCCWSKFNKLTNWLRNTGARSSARQRINEEFGKKQGI